MFMDYFLEGKFKVGIISTEKEQKGDGQATTSARKSQ